LILDYLAVPTDIAGKVYHYMVSNLITKVTVAHICQ